LLLKVYKLDIHDLWLNNYFLHFYFMVSYGQLNPTYVLFIDEEIKNNKLFLYKLKLINTYIINIFNKLNKTLISFLFLVYFYLVFIENCIYSKRINIFIHK